MKKKRVTKRKKIFKKFKKLSKADMRKIISALKGKKLLKGQKNKIRKAIK